MEESIKIVLSILSKLRVPKLVDHYSKNLLNLYKIRKTIKKDDFVVESMTDALISMGNKKDVLFAI